MVCVRRKGKRSVCDGRLLFRFAAKRRRWKTGSSLVNMEMCSCSSSTNKQYISDWFSPRFLFWLVPAFKKGWHNKPFLLEMQICKCDSRWQWNEVTRDDPLFMVDSIRLMPALHYSSGVVPLGFMTSFYIYFTAIKEREFVSLFSSSSFSSSRHEINNSARPLEMRNTTFLIYSFIFSLWKRASSFFFSLPLSLQEELWGHWNRYLFHRNMLLP